MESKLYFYYFKTVLDLYQYKYEEFEYKTTTSSNFQTIVNSYDVVNYNIIDLLSNENSKKLDAITTSNCKIYHSQLSLLKSSILQGNNYHLLPNLVGDSHHFQLY